MPLVIHVPLLKAHGPDSDDVTAGTLGKLCKAVDLNAAALQFGESPQRGRRVFDDE